MARPKNDQPGPNAKERMANAFWEVLEEKSYERMTVRDIAEHTQINRNAFYYHFQNMDALAEWAFAREVPTEIPRLMLFKGPDEVCKFLSDPVNEERVRRVRLAVSDHGSKIFAGLLKEEFIHAWCEVLEIDPETFSRQQRIVADFIAGGMFAVMANSKDISTEDLVQFISSSGMHEKMFDLVTNSLKTIFEPSEERLRKYDQINRSDN